MKKDKGHGKQGGRPKPEFKDFETSLPNQLDNIKLEKKERKYKENKNRKKIDTETKKKKNSSTTRKRLFATNEYTLYYNWFSIFNS